jgi:Iap family predicted aminopeptidase
MPPIDGAAMLRHVRVLADEIGPREATSDAFGRAADYVETRFRQAGLTVRRQPLRVPAGVSWGVRVPTGETLNLIAVHADVDPQAAHLVVGAHLDTVPQAPGAEDNASGIGVLLELARLVAATRMPAVLIAFGAEEPRGEGDLRHHYGSRHYVTTLDARERDAIGGMVSMDRVGVGANVRIRTSREGSTPVSRALVALARRERILVSQGVNRSSDHWQFDQRGIPAARIGGHPFAAYHSERDRPSFVRQGQLYRTGRLVWAWLSA